MYLEHFQLKAAPFAISPDPRFFYTGGKCKKLLAVLHDRLSQGCICAFTGVKGVGKSVVIIQLCRKFGREYKIVRLSRPDMTAENLLNYLVLELKLADELLEVAAAEQHLQNWLAQEGAKNRLIIMVENADKMPLASRQALSKLCDFPCSTGNMLSVLLSGSIALQGSLAESEGVSLAASYTLPRLSSKEVHEYLNYRATEVGHYPVGELFNKAVSKHIAKLSDGIPRNIHLLADKVLCAAFLAKAPAPTVEMLSDTPSLEETTVDDLPAEQHGHEWMLGLGCVFFAVLIYYWDFSSSPDEVTVPVVEQTVSQDVPIVDAFIDEDLELETNYATAVEDVPIIGAENSAFEPVADKLEEPVITQAKAKPPVLILHKPPASALAKSQQRLLAWLAVAPHTAGTIQLLLVKGGEGSRINEYLMQLENNLDTTQLMTYSTVLNGQAYYGVLYQRYASRALASENIQKLPAAVQKLGPFIVRSAKGVKDEQGQI